jgi:hypothetical protein
MGGVAEDVSAPLVAISEITKGLAAKNQTMKDGPSQGGGGGAASGGKTVAKPSAEEKKSAYDQYKKDIEDVWRKNTGADGKIADPISLGLGIGQAITDLALKAGPDVIKVFGEIMKLGK